MFKHKPLRRDIQEVRIFKFEEVGYWFALRLEHVDLNSNPTYIALSYTWDDPIHESSTTHAQKPKSDITMNDKRFEVGKSLEDALAGLWINYGEEESFWVDAICIDQSSKAERGEQVSIMNRIYSKSQFTFAWLGPSDDQTEMAARKIGHFVFGAVEESRELKLQLGFRSEEAFTNLAQIIRREFAAENRQAWKAVANIFKRRYWRRAWIVQEVALARITHIHCGGCNMGTWATFRRLHEALSTWTKATASSKLFDSHPAESALRLFDEVFEALSIVSTLCNFTRAYDESEVWLTTNTKPVLFPLLDSVARIRASDCEDPRDKIFAVLGLSEENLQLVTKPDHDRAASLLFRNFAREIIRRDLSLHILGYCLYPSLPGHPSWAPDWSNCAGAGIRAISSSGPSNWFYGKGPSRALFSAGSDRPLAASFRDNDRILVLHGGCLDELAYVADRPGPSLGHGIWDQLYVWASYLAAHPNMFKFVDRAGYSYAASEGIAQFNTPVYRLTSESVYDAFVRTTHADSLTQAHNESRVRMTDDACATQLGDGSFALGVDPVMFGQVFAVTHLGFFCLVPQQAVPGDMIAVVAGGQVPLVLRPDDRGRKVDRLVGECYAHGVMDGYGMDYVTSKEPLREISIR